MAEAGQSLRRYVLASVTKQVGSRAAQEVAKRTVLAPLAALTLPVTVAGALGAGLDSLFVRAKSKAVKQGEQRVKQARHRSLLLTLEPRPRARPHPR